MRGAGVGLNRTKENDMTQGKYIKALLPMARFMAWARRSTARLRAWIKGVDTEQDERIRNDFRELIETVSPSETPFYSTVNARGDQANKWQTDALPK
jgi:hypothetical protein